MTNIVKKKTDPNSDFNSSFLYSAPNSLGLIKHDYLLSDPKKMKNVISRDSIFTNNEHQVNESFVSMTEFNENEEYRMLANRVKLFLLINIIPLFLIAFSVIYYGWATEKLLYESEPPIQIAFGLIYVYLEDEYDPFMSINDFIENYCWNKMKNVDCKAKYDIFMVTGNICFFFFALGMFMHIFHIIQLVLILINRYKYLQLPFCIKTKTLHVLVFMLYIGGMLIWITFLVNSNDTDLGLSFYFCISATFLYILVFFYFIYLKKKLKEAKMISNLLNPEKVIRAQN